MFRKFEKSSDSWLFDLQFTIPDLGLTVAQEQLVKTVALTVATLTALWATTGKVIQEATTVNAQMKEGFSHDVQRQIRGF